MQVRKGARSRGTERMQEAFLPGIPLFLDQRARIVFRNGRMYVDLDPEYVYNRTEAGEPEGGVT